MKYVILEASQGSIRRKVPVIFPATLVHSEVAKAYKQVLARHGYTDVAAYSAGEVSLFGASLICSGHSETLGVTSKEDDSKTIELYDYMGGL